MFSLYIRKILYLRYTQMMRLLYDMGNLAIFIAIVFGFLMTFLFFVFKDKTMSLPMAILLFFSLYQIHNSRKDKLFLSNHFEKVSTIYRIEYGALLTPFFILCLFTINLHLLLYLVLILIIIPYINFNKQSIQGNKVISLLPTLLFEWKAGLRKTYLFPFVLYLVAFPSVLVEFLPMLVLFFCSTAIASFYDENEEVLLLEQFGKNGVEIFKNKIFIAIKYLTIAYAPILLLSSCIYPNIAIYNLIFLINQIVLIAFIITVKYKHFMPTYSPIKNSNFSATFILLSIMPFFFFIPLFYILAYYKKAINKINQFL